MLQNPFPRLLSLQSLRRARRPLTPNWETSSMKSLISFIMYMLPFLGATATSFLGAIATSAPGEVVSVWNSLNSSVHVCTNVAPGSFQLVSKDTREFQLPDYGSSLVVLACDMGDSECIKCQNPRATMAEFKRTSNGDINYKVSAKNGYNICMDIRPLGKSICHTVTCAGNLDKCPEGLRVQSNSTRAVVGCQSPDDCFNSEQECSTYFSMVAESQCEMPSSSGSSFEHPSSEANCLSAFKLILSQ